MVDGVGPVGWVFISVGVIIFILMFAFLLLQKHCCSPEASRIGSRFFLWPCMPLTAFGQRFKKNGWWHKVDDKVLVGAIPLQCFGHVNKLHACGVRAVVNMMDEYSGPKEAYARLGMEQLHMRVVDHEAPTFEQTVVCVNFIEKHVNAGSTVYVHCKGGHGRSGAIGFAWLMFKHQMSLEEAQQHIRSRRRVRKRLFTQPELVQFHRQFVVGKEDLGAFAQKLGHLESPSSGLKKRRWKKTSAKVSPIE